VPSVRRQIRIAAPPGEVWAVLADPASISKWWPGITGATVDGAVRTVTLASGLAVEEEILDQDHDRRRLRYRAKLPVLRHHLATVDVEADGDGTLVTYVTDIEPDPMAFVFGGASGAALEGLRRLVEEGVATRG
jgi:carbon monoxide dehydrogenase subunit G